MEISKIRDGTMWRWRWDGWTSSAHEFLEERPWTPMVVADRLCFVARDEGMWSVNWGDTAGVAHDDAYDLSAFEEQPLYIAREGEEWFLVHGVTPSTRYPFQITYKVEQGDLRIFKFHPIGPWELIGKPMWQPRHAVPGLR